MIKLFESVLQFQLKKLASEKSHSFLGRVVVKNLEMRRYDNLNYFWIICRCREVFDPEIEWYEIKIDVFSGSVSLDNNRAGKLNNKSDNVLRVPVEMPRIRLFVGDNVFLSQSNLQIFIIDYRRYYFI